MKSLVVLLLLCLGGCGNKVIEEIAKSNAEKAKMLSRFNSDLQSTVSSTPITKFETFISIFDNDGRRYCSGRGWISSSNRRVMCDAQYVEVDVRFELAAISINLQQVVKNKDLLEKYKLLATN